MTVFTFLTLQKSLREKRQFFVAIHKLYKQFLFLYTCFGVNIISNDILPKEHNFLILINDTKNFVLKFFVNRFAEVNSAPLTKKHSFFRSNFCPEIVTFWLKFRHKIFMYP